MRRAELDSALDQFFSRKFPTTHFLAEILKKYVGSETRKETSARRETLLAQQKTLAQKRVRIIEFALDGTITKIDRDRRLKVVDDDLDLNRRGLAEAVEPRLPSYREWNQLMAPFRNFESLPLEERRNLITSRFQEVRVKDYRVVSLYLLTGEITLPDQFPTRSKADPNHCYSCGRALYSPRKIYDGVAYCNPCFDGIAFEQERIDLAQRGVRDPEHEASNDSFQQL